MSNNCSFQFELPMQNNDLLNSSGDKYYVQQVYSLNDISEKLLACRQKVNQGDPFYIFEHFDTYFSVIEWRGTDATTLRTMMRSFDLLYLTTDKLGTQLTPLLGTTEPPSQEERVSYLNLTKMTLFLFVNIVKGIDSAIVKINKESQMGMGLKKQRGKHSEIMEQYPDWDVKRSKFLIQIFNIMQCQLEKLWSPPMPEENFVNMLCDICYRTLEIAHARADNSHIIDTVFQILGTAIKRYNHALTFPTRILQLLRNSENASVPIANGIQLLSDEYGITTVFAILVKDIVETLSNDANDTLVSRNFSNFLTEFSHIAPKLMIPHLSNIGDKLLDCETYTVRNCVLQIMGDIIVGELTSEDLNDEMKEARNEFLENLLDHINDISAHVRAKVLHIWHSLKDEHAVPLTYQIKVMREAVCRLEDKTSIVRKGAVQLIRAFLESNPYSGKLTLEELIEKHKVELENLEKMNVVVAEHRKKIEALEDEWNASVPQILKIIEKNLREQPEIETDLDADYEGLVKELTPHLLEKRYEEAMRLIRQADMAAGNNEINLLLEQDERHAYYLALFKTFLTLANGCPPNDEEMEKQIEVVHFLEDSIEFSNIVTNAMPKLQEFLMSKTNSDVFEAVDLFTTGYLFSIKGTEAGMRQMLYLVWSSDKEKRDAVSNAYRKVLFTTDQTGRAHAIKVVQNLSRFLSQIEYGHYTALETLMGEWVSTDDIDALIVQVLFERFTLKLEGTTPNESRLALQLLVMASEGKSSIASMNISVIESICIGERASHDPFIFTTCLHLLLNSIDANQISKYYKRLSSETSFVQKVISMFLKFFFHQLLPNFEKLATATFDFFYKMCQSPDLIAQQIIVELNRKFNASWVQTLEQLESLQQQKSINQQQQQQNPGETKEDIPYSQILPESQALTQSQSNERSGPVRIQVYLASRFIFCIGYMTLKEMIFLDIDVYNNMKYREELTQLEEKKNKSTVLNSVRRQTASLNISTATEVRKRLSGNNGEQQQEADEDLVGATAEDNIAEEINGICEDILLYENSALLSKIYPIIIDICKKPGEYRDQGLQQAATLTLARLMTVSSKFCENNMSFLMNILTLTKNIKIKCNSVICLSDLTFRFPNIIEPWTGHFYSTLHDENKSLRLTAVKMLSHLILHEMIRVKGQISHLALCIVDSEPEIRAITIEFFKEIANKSNILYNVLPDIISKLSDTNFHVEEEKYHIIMRHILGLIQKDRQVETLVEKLCLRFPLTHEERQWRDIAYCLSLLTYNERAIRKLIDNVQHYKDKVQVDEVHQAFKLIISNTSKMAKPEIKTILAELETRIKECLEVRDPNALRDSNTPSDATPVKSGSGRQNITRRAKRGGSLRGAGNRRTGGRRRQDSSDSDCSDEQPARSNKVQNKRKSSIDSSSSTEEDVPSKKTRARGRKM